MNINNVYLCEIARCMGENSDGTYKCERLKYALVYHTKDDKWIDIESKEKYSYGLSYFYSYVIPLFINDSGIMIPVTELIDTKRNHMTKRKVLTLYEQKRNELKRSK